MEGGEKGKRRIKLFCPSVSKVVQIVAGDEQKLNLGSIAWAFGLDPNTLKLNGYFISRGADLIASSVTWKSLIRFFSARGLSTGATDCDALCVDGKLSEIGPKRLHGVEDVGNGIINAKEQGYCRDSKRPRHEHCSVHNNKGNPGLADWNKTSGLCLKRKLGFEDESRFKRTRADEAVSGKQEFAEKSESFCSDLGLADAPTKSRFSCSIISKSLKRMTVDDMVAAPAPASKRIR